MLEWRKLEEPKYLTGPQAYEEGVVESAFGYVGYKLRAELDYRVIGGRGGVDTGQNYWDDNFLYGPFGTEENPVLVPSRGRYRFVGCVGGYDGKAEHETAWFCLNKAPNTDALCVDRFGNYGPQIHHIKTIHIMTPTKTMKQRYCI